MSNDTAWAMAQYYAGIGKAEPEPQPEPLIECPKCGSYRIGQFDNDGEPYGYYKGLNPPHLYDNWDYAIDDNGEIVTPLRVHLPMFSITVNVCHNCRFMWNPEYSEAA